MSTKIAKSAPSVTEQVRPTIYNQIKAAVGSVAWMGWTAFPEVTWNAPATSTNCAVYKVSKKAAEAQRQIERVRAIGNGSIDDGMSEDRRESIASSVTLLETLLSSPIPIPIASSGSDAAATLFLEDKNFYGDIEINGRTIDYYIRAVVDGQPVEICDSEELNDCYIPPRLLGCLFSHYTR